MHMRTMIVGGGALRPAFLASAARCLSPDFVIAADRGIDALHAADIRPGLILGDYDSADAAVLRSARSSAARDGAQVLTYPAEKNFSDMEAAVREAVKRNSGEIWLLGATGGRLDHFLANILNLTIGTDAGTPSFMLDEQNLLFVTERPVLFRREDEERRLTVIFSGCGPEYTGDVVYVTARMPRAFRYLSFLPLGGPVEKLSLTGVKYPLEAFRLDGRAPSLTISNEMTEAEARADFDSGRLIVILSGDGRPDIFY